MAIAATGPFDPWSRLVPRKDNLDGYNGIPSTSSDTEGDPLNLLPERAVDSDEPRGEAQVLTDSSTL